MDWEGCSRETAGIHYKSYCEAFDKKNHLTILEYATIMEIDPCELFLRLDINFTIFNPDQLALCMLKLKRRLEAMKQMKTSQQTAEKIKKTALAGQKKAGQNK